MDKVLDLPFAGRNLRITSYRASMQMYIIAMAVLCDSTYVLSSSKLSSLSALNATDTGTGSAVRATVNRDIDEGLHSLLYFSLPTDLCNAILQRVTHSHCINLTYPCRVYHGIKSCSKAPGNELNVILQEGPRDSA